MTDLAPLLPKIRPLVRMFQSDNENEAMGALRALGRVLGAAGMSFHDLADSIGQEPAVSEGYGDAYWKPPPRRYSGSADFVAPGKGRRPQPRPAGPPLWEGMEKKLRFAWLNRLVDCDKLTPEQRKRVGELRAQNYSQPHKVLRPAEAAEISTIFSSAWIDDVRPIADVVPGDKRLPLVWTGSNRESVRVVLSKALPVFSHRDGEFAMSVVARIGNSAEAFSSPSLDELERIDRLLVFAYDAGARP